VSSYVRKGWIKGEKRRRRRVQLRRRIVDWSSTRETSGPGRSSSHGGRESIVQPSSAPARTADGPTRRGPIRIGARPIGDTPHARRSLDAAIESAPQRLDAGVRFLRKHGHPPMRVPPTATCRARQNPRFSRTIDACAFLQSSTVWSANKMPVSSLLRIDAARPRDYLNHPLLRASSLRLRDRCDASHELFYGKTRVRRLHHFSREIRRPRI
jgi:hypothetical protein